MNRWLIAGAGGMLGLDLADRLRGEGAQVTALARRDLDVTDAAAIRGAFQRVRPDVVVNCAAWTAVDRAEANEADARAVNGDGPANLAAAALPAAYASFSCPRITCSTAGHGSRTPRTLSRRRSAPTAGPS